MGHCKERHPCKEADAAVIFHRVEAYTQFL